MSIRVARHFSRACSVASQRRAAVSIQQRKVHGSAAAFSWVSKMRPDLHETLQATKAANDDAHKAAVSEAQFWWRQANTDVMAKRISKQLQKGGSVRPGIIQILMQKAWKEEHVKTALQGLTWMQTKFNVDMTRADLVLLLKAIIRVKSPQIAVDLFTTMNWIRVWPTIGEMHMIMKYLADQAHFLAVKTPSMKEKKEYDTDVVEPAPNALPHEEEAEEEAAEEKESKKKLSPEQLLEQQFTKILEVLADPRFELKMDYRAHELAMQFWAARGQVEKASRAWAEMHKLNAAAADSSLDYIAFAFLVSGDLKRAARQFQQSPSRPAPKNRDADPFAPAKSRGFRMMLAVAEGNVDAAVALLKEAKNPYSVSYASTHLGFLPRFATVQEAFKALDANTDKKMPAEFAEFLTKVEQHLQEIAPKAAEEGAEKEEEK